MNIETYSGTQFMCSRCSLARAAGKLNTGRGVPPRLSVAHLIAVDVRAERRVLEVDARAEYRCDGWCCGAEMRWGLARVSCARPQHDAAVE